jgi:4-amino-4-deoxy-L-arabinose transferase-like glycosyltransferase
MSDGTATAFGLPWSPRRWGVTIYVAAAVVAAIVVFVLFGRQSLVGQNRDPYGFGLMGQSIADGNSFQGFGSLLHRRSPLYPIVVGGVYWVFGPHLRAMLVVHCLMFAATAVLAYDLARRLFNLRTGIIAAALCILHPLLLRYTPHLHLETQLILLYTLLVWLLVRFRQQPTLLNAAFVGVVAGLNSLTKAVAVLLPLVFLVGLLVERRNKAKRGETVTAVPWLPFATVFVTMGLTIMPWTIRNYQVTGHFVPITSGTSDAFLRGFIFSETKYITLSEPPYTGAENASNAYFNRLAEEAGTVWERDDYESDQILNEEAKRRFKAEPLAVVRKTVIGVFTFWYQLTSLPSSALALTAAVGAWALAIIAWRRAKQSGISTWQLFLPVIYLNAVLAPLLALGRYSAPVLPTLMILAAFGIDGLLDRVMKAKAAPSLP